jgi:hypothetical protein
MRVFIELGQSHVHGTWTEQAQTKLPHCHEALEKETVSDSGCRLRCPTVVFTVATAAKFVCNPETQIP